MTAKIAIDSKKCSATSQGLRCVSTVRPPSTAWAGMPSAATVASARSRTSAIATSQVATATTASTKVSCRLVNSIRPWIAYCLVGVSDESVHLGQVGQPSPESVNRTAPPVTTMTTFETTDANASPRNQAGVCMRSGNQRTGEGVRTGVATPT